MVSNTNLCIITCIILNLHADPSLQMQVAVIELKVHLWPSETCFDFIVS